MKYTIEKLETTDNIYTAHIATGYAEILFGDTVDEVFSDYRNYDEERETWDLIATSEDGKTFYDRGSYLSLKEVIEKAIDEICLNSVIIIIEKNRNNRTIYEIFTIYGNNSHFNEKIVAKIDGKILRRHNFDSDSEYKECLKENWMEFLIN